MGAWKNDPNGRVRNSRPKIPAHRLMGRPRDVLLNTVIQSTWKTQMYTMVYVLCKIRSAHSVRKEDLGTLSRPKVFSAVDQIGICSQGEEDASRLNLHLITGSTDPQMLFSVIYCYLDTYWILHLIPMICQDLALLQAKRVPFYLIHPT